MNTNNFSERIFLSSTFDDKMIQNRDVFRSDLIAEFNRISGNVGVNIFLSDLELGILDGVSKTQAIVHCLEEIDKSDYFIGILGDNYGDVITKADFKLIDSKHEHIVKKCIDEKKSVLELEIQYALSKPIPKFFMIKTNNGQLLMKGI